MNSTFELSILAPERRLTQSELVTSVILTTSEGEIEVLAGHANMVSQLEPGRFVYKTAGGQVVTGVISSGFVNVEDGQVKVVAETIELAGEIDKSRAKVAQNKAEQMLSSASLDASSFRKYQLKLQRSIIRQSVAI